MGRYKKAVWIAASNFMCWRRDYRVISVFLIEGVLLVRYFGGLLIYAIQSKTTMTIYLLPILFADADTANGLYKILIYFGFLVLICNAPFANQQTPYMILRSSRKIWTCGQLIYMIFAAFVYLCFLTLGSALISLPVMEWSRGWGSVFQELNGTEAILFQNQLVIPKEIISSIYPAAAEWITFLSAWMSFSLMGLIVYTGNVLSSRPLGVAIAVLLVLLDPVVRWLAWGKAKWWQYYCSPVSWVSMEHWDILGMNHPIHASYTCILTAGICVCLLIILMKKIKRTKISQVGI